MLLLLLCGCLLDDVEGRRVCADRGPSASVIFTRIDVM